jgi:hypothetical protein
MLLKRLDARALRELFSLPPDIPERPDDIVFIPKRNIASPL